MSGKSDRKKSKSVLRQIFMGKRYSTLTSINDQVRYMAMNAIFMMDSDLKILPLYSRPLISILSYYDSELAGKNFLDILASSLDIKQLQIMKGYFSMVFTKAKSTKVLESANPISEFEYRTEDQLKTLATKFHLIQHKECRRQSGDNLFR
jgi:hypothetical protein